MGLQRRSSANLNLGGARGYPEKETRRLHGMQARRVTHIALGTDATNRRNYIFVSWPRTSPPLLASVWMLTYQLPAVRSAAWASVSVADPSNGLALDLIGTATPAFLPAAAGPWKCAA